MSRNLPDGCRVDDLPGYWDTECPDCEEWETSDGCARCEGTGIVDKRDWTYDV